MCWLGFAKCELGLVRLFLFTSWCASFLLVLRNDCVAFFYILNGRAFPLFLHAYEAPTSNIAYKSIAFTLHVYVYVDALGVLCFI